MIAIKKAFQEKDILLPLKTLLICPFLKPGKKDETDPINYRPIALLAQFLKLFTSILYQRVSDYCEGKCGCSDGTKFHELSNGFRPKRSTLDNILILREVILDSRHRKRGKDRVLFLCFLDIAKAFDKVDREILFKRLWDMGIRGKLWRVIKKLLTKF